MKSQTANSVSAQRLTSRRDVVPRLQSPDGVDGCLFMGASGHRHAVAGGRRRQTHTRNSDGRTARDHASSCGHPKIVDLLNRSGA